MGFGAVALGLVAWAAVGTAGVTQQRIQCNSHHLFSTGRSTGPSHPAAASCSHVKYSLKLHPWGRLAGAGSAYPHGTHAVPTRRRCLSAALWFLSLCSPPRRRVACPSAARNPARQPSDSGVSRLVGQKQSMKSRNATNSVVSEEGRNSWVQYLSDVLVCFLNGVWLEFLRTYCFVCDTVSVCWQILICSSGLLAGQGLRVLSAFQWHCQGTLGLLPLSVDTQKLNVT